MSGDPGAGKTTMCELLAKELGYTYFYMGGLFRQMAKERGISIEEFYEEVANNPELERAADEQSERLMQQNDKLIMEGRMAPFQKTSFKTINILLRVSPREGARRQSLRPENKGKDIAEIERLTKERVQHEREHYHALYGIEDHFDESKFDIVFNTTKTSIEEAFRIVLGKLREKGV